MTNGTINVNLLLHAIDRKDKTLERYERALITIIEHEKLHGQDCVVCKHPIIDIARKALYD